MTRGVIHDQDTEKLSEKHMGGCIAGFFHIFDRNHVVSSKRLSPKRISHTSDGFESTSSVGSPAISREFDRSNPRSKALSDHLLSPVVHITPPSSTVRDVSARSSIAVSSFEFKEGLKSPSKFTRELPRLSLDSLLHPRGIKTKVGGVRYDDEGSETQRRSPSVVARLMGLEPLLPSSESGSDLSEKVELQRSLSESRSKDLLHCRRFEGKVLPENAQITEKTNGGRRFSNCDGNVHTRAPEPAMRPRRMIAQQQRKGLCNYGDFSPEPSVEKRLKMRGTEEPSSDLNNLKGIGRRNIVYNRCSPNEDSPIVVMKPVKSPRRPAPRRSDKLSSPTPSRRSENRSRSPVTTRRKNPLNIEKQRRVSHSQSPRRRKSAAEIRPEREEDESSPISNIEKPKMEESCKDGSSLIERCNKLLNSIEEMSSTSKNSTESQLSPVSVLDSSLYKEDESPSAVMKRSKDTEDEIWSHKDMFSMLEKEQFFNAKGSSKSSILERRLIFDTITEIIDRNKPLEISHIWSELQRIQKRDESNLAGDSGNGWRERQLEMSEVVIDVERLIFRDLIKETIRDLMGSSSESRRKLVF